MPATDAKSPGNGGALEGLRVVDFSHFVAGPMVSMIMGDYGADVIKVEKPHGGDDFRFNRLVGKDVHGAPYLWVNRNKRSVALDLNTPAGLEIARELTDTADVVLENFSTGVMERLGLDYETIAATNRTVIYCSVSAAGREGSMADRAGFDTIAQAESGFMQLMGQSDAVAAVAGAPIIDMTTAMMACNSVLAALAARYRLGIGQQVQVCLYDQAVAMLGYHAQTWLMTDKNPRPTDREPAPVPGVGTYDTADEPIVLCCASDRTYQRLAEDVLGRPDLAAPPLDTIAGRAKNRDELPGKLGEILKEHSLQHWLGLAKEAAVPAAPLASLDQALVSDGVVERGLVTHIDHPSIGSVPNIASPSRFSATPVVEPVAAPELGQHTTEVLAEVLGYSDERLDQCRRSGAFGEKAATD